MNPDLFTRELADLKRRVLNIQRIATVIKVDAPRQKAKVQDGEWTSDWLRWIETRAGAERSWSPPQPNERVMVFSPGGDLDQAVILAGLPCIDNPPPDTSRHRCVRQMTNGALFRHDSVSHAALIELPDKGELKIKIGQTTIIARSNGIKITTPSMTANGKPMATVGDNVPVGKGSSAGTYQISTGVGS